MKVHRLNVCYTTEKGLEELIDVVTRMTWAMGLVHVPEEGISPAKFFVQAGYFAGASPILVGEVLYLFHKQYGPHKKIMRTDSVWCYLKK